jgi:hypothetical protein
VVLADTPRLRLAPVRCLRAHPRNVAACVTNRASASHPDHDRTEQAAARDAGERYMNLSWKTCPYDPCPLIMGRIMMWRDHAHITATFSRQLAPSMRQRLIETVPSLGPDARRR